MALLPRLVSATIVLILVIFWLLPTSSITKEPPAQPSEPGVVTFDPCMMWSYMPWTLRLGILGYVIAFLTLLLRGLWNKTGPWWLAILGLVSIGFVANDEYERRMCQTLAGLIDTGIVLASHAGMFLLHLRRTRS